MKPIFFVFSNGFVEGMLATSDVFPLGDFEDDLLSGELVDSTSPYRCVQKPIRIVKGVGKNINVQFLLQFQAAGELDGLFLTNLIESAAIFISDFGKNISGRFSAWPPH